MGEDALDTGWEAPGQAISLSISTLSCAVAQSQPWATRRVPKHSKQPAPTPWCHLQLGGCVDEQVVHVGQRSLQRLQAVVAAAAPLRA